MKKILATFLAGAMLVATPATGIFADEIANGTEGTVKLTATYASSYTLKIPTSVDVSATGTTFDIEAKGDVDTAKKIVISEKNAGANYLVDNAESTNKVQVEFVQGSDINGSTVTSGYNDTAKTTITINHGTLTAGSYTCDLPIVISLQNIAAQ